MRTRWFSRIALTSAIGRRQLRSTSQHQLAIPLGARVFSQLAARQGRLIAGRSRPTAAPRRTSDGP